jgi:hypothetical protein
LVPIGYITRKKLIKKMEQCIPKISTPLISSSPFPPIFLMGITQKTNANVLCNVTPLGNGKQLSIF